jgi:hypothetical protein
LGQILRVGAVNGAAFEWIQHETVGRAHGLTTAQLYIIRDTSTPLPPAEGLLTTLQMAALRFADASTRDIHVSKAVTDDLMHELREYVEKANPNEDEALRTERIQDLFVEASAVVATYNMVSRFIVSTDVAGLSGEAVPWGIERKEAINSILHSCCLCSYRNSYSTLYPYLLKRTRPWAHI